MKKICRILTKNRSTALQYTHAILIKHSRIPSKNKLEKINTIFIASLAYTLTKEDSLKSLYRDFILKHTDKNLLWKYYLDRTDSLPHDLDSTSLALQIILNLNSQKEKNYCLKHLNRILSHSLKNDLIINAWILKNSSPLWRHEDITVLSHCGRLYNSCIRNNTELTPTSQRIFSEINHRITCHITQNRQSIFYVNRTWALYALSTWFSPKLTIELLEKCIDELLKQINAIGYISLNDYILVYCSYKNIEHTVPKEIQNKILQIYTSNIHRKIVHIKYNPIYFEKIINSEIFTANSNHITMLLAKMYSSYVYEKSYTSK